MKSNLRLVLSGSPGDVAAYALYGRSAVKGVGVACDWERPRAPSVRLLWDVRATDAVLGFLRTTRVGCRGTERVRPEDRGEASDREGGGPGPP